MTTAEQLSVGDEVAVKTRFETYLAKVARVTKTQVIVRDATGRRELRFRRADGREVGASADTWGGATLLPKVTDEILDEILRRSLLATLVHLRREDLAGVPTSNLAKAAALLGRKQP